MLHTFSFLEQCHQLLKKNFLFKLIPGRFIGRGFADVGYEEYSCLTNNQAVSLDSGKIIELNEQYQNFYFPILTPDEISVEIYKRDWDIQQIFYQDSRVWIMDLINKKLEKSINIKGSNLEELFLNALLSII